MQPNNENIEQKVVELFSANNNYTVISYNGSIVTLEISGEVKELKLVLDTIFEDVKILPGNKLEIKLSSVKSDKHLIFYDEEDFINNYEKYGEYFDEKCIVILFSKWGVIIKSERENFSADKALIFNYPIYRELLSYLTAKNEFTPYHDDLNKQFVIISKDTGAFYIGYDLLESRLQEVEDLKTPFTLLKEYFTKKEFIQFFKEVVITGTHSSKVEDRFFELVKTLKVILSVTERDYENYILDFAFDKIKSKFKEERNKYFESLEKGIDSVSKQVVSFPLTFAATAFASYQVKDRPVILALIVLAYFLYTVVASKILQFVKYNVLCLIEDVDREEGEIKNSYNKLYADFEADFKKIREKIAKLNTILSYLKWILWGLLILFIIYSSYQIIINGFSKATDEQTLKIKTSNIKMSVEKKEPYLDSAHYKKRIKKLDTLKILKNNNSNNQLPVKAN